MECSRAIFPCSLFFFTILFFLWFSHTHLTHTNRNHTVSDFSQHRVTGSCTVRQHPIDITGSWCQVGSGSPYNILYSHTHHTHTHTVTHTRETHTPLALSLVSSRPIKESYAARLSVYLL